MSASARRRKSRQRAAQLTASARRSPGSFRPAPGYMARPEERRKHVARLGGPHDPTHVDGRYFDPRETEYAPLTVSTPLRDSRGRINPRSRSQYTV